MPVYTFDLRDGSDGVADREGIALRDPDHATDYALQVIRELLQGNELEARQWQLDVYEDGRQRIFSIPFASVDHSLDHLSPQLRRNLETCCDRARALKEAMSAARATIRESRAVVARSRRQPYLAAVRGKSTIRR